MQKAWTTETPTELQDEGLAKRKTAAMSASTCPAATFAKRRKPNERDRNAMLRLSSRMPATRIRQLPAGIENPLADATPTICPCRISTKRRTIPLNSKTFTISAIWYGLEFANEKDSKIPIRRKMVTEAFPRTDRKRSGRPYSSVSCESHHECPVFRHGESKSSWIVEMGESTFTDF